MLQEASITSVTS